MTTRESSELVRHTAYPIEHNRFERRVNMAIMLPGQDVRKPGMFDEAMKHPAGREVIERGVKILAQEFGYNLLEIASKVEDKDEVKRNAKILRETQYTQPAVYLLAIAVHNVNRHHHNKDGYKTVPEYSGVSMGIGTAAALTAAGLGGLAAVGVGIHEVITRHNPLHHQSRK